MDHFENTAEVTYHHEPHQAPAVYGRHSGYC